VSATDLDQGLNSQIEYSIVSGNQAGAFRIDELNGVILTNSILDYESSGSYRCTQVHTHQRTLRKVFPTEPLGKLIFPLLPSLQSTFGHSQIVLEVISYFEKVTGSYLEVDVFS
jgi:hypothetical protein